MSDPVVVIPARMAAQRLPGKPMADIHGKPMIVHVWRRAVEAGIGPVIVATDAPEIAAAIKLAGGIAVMTREEEKTAMQVVKAVASPISGRHYRALYFTRATAPWGEGDLFHHIGLYAYRRKALARFVSLPPSPLEKREKLEQLRALEAGMRIDIIKVDTVPHGVDTPEDLERARQLLST